MSVTSKLTTSSIYEDQVSKHPVLKTNTFRWVDPVWVTTHLQTLLDSYTPSSLQGWKSIKAVFFMLTTAQPNWLPKTNHPEPCSIDHLHNLANELSSASNFPEAASRMERSLQKIQDPGVHIAAAWHAFQPPSCLPPPPPLSDSSNRTTGTKKSSKRRREVSPGSAPCASAPSSCSESTVAATKSQRIESLGDQQDAAMSSRSSRSAHSQFTNPEQTPQRS